jgi:hypothetical protein
VRQSADAGQVPILRVEGRNVALQWPHRSDEGVNVT